MVNTVARRPLLYMADIFQVHVVVRYNYPYLAPRLEYPAQEPQFHAISLR